MRRRLLVSSLKTCTPTSPTCNAPEVRTARWLSLSGCQPICSTRSPGRLANSSASSTTASHTSCTACALAGAAPPPRLAPPAAEPCTGLVGAAGAGRQLVRSTTTTLLISGSSSALPATAAYVPERLSAKCDAVSSSGGEAVRVRRRSGGVPPDLVPPCGVQGGAGHGRWSHASAAQRSQRLKAHRQGGSR